MIEYLQNIIFSISISAISFWAGALWMRENYIGVIRQLNAEIESLTRSRRV